MHLKKITSFLSYFVSYNDRLYILYIYFSYQNLFSHPFHDLFKSLCINFEIFLTFISIKIDDSLRIYKSIIDLSTYSYLPILFILNNIYHDNLEQQLWH